MKKKTKTPKKTQTDKFVLRVAVSGSTRDELADSLLTVAEEIRTGGMVTNLANDNCAGPSKREDGTPFDFDYQVFSFPKDGVVSILPGPDE